MNPSSKSDIETLEAELGVATNEISRLKTELEHYKQSPVWRAYGIVRRIVTILRLFTNAPKNIRRSGGLRATTFVGLRMIKAYGLIGFLQFLFYRLFKPGVSPNPGSGRFDRHNYTAWFKTRKNAHSSLTATKLDSQPLLSIVVPVFRPDINLFKEAIESILTQTYERWELCIADDASSQPELTDYLKSLTQIDSRIKVEFRETNGHIAACSNSALALASGEFIVLFDQDDLLPPHALERVAQYIGFHPNASIFYSDEDRIDSLGQLHLSAYFKPDFNYDLFLGQNLISHLGVYRKSLVEQVGGFSAEFTGSQDWDLALRVLECINHKQVIHIPEVLYHWRAVEGSTALNHSAKKYAMHASRRAISAHLQRTGQQGKVLPSSHHSAYNRIRYDLPSESLTSALLLGMPSSQSYQQTQDLLSSHSGAIKIEQVIRVQDDFLNINTLRTQIEQLQHDLIVYVGIELFTTTNNWLEELSSLALQSRAGFVAPRIVDRSGKNPVMDHGGIVWTDKRWAVCALKGIPDYSPGYVGRNILQQRFQMLSPAVLVVDRKRLLRTIEQSSEVNMKGAWLWLHLCMLMHQQQHNLYMPEVTMSFKDYRCASPSNWFFHKHLTPESLKQWEDCWGSQPNDPAYNPNLSPDGDFSLNWRLGQRSA